MFLDMSGVRPSTTTITKAKQEDRLRRIKQVLLILLALGLVAFFLQVGLPVLKEVAEYNKENADYTLHTTPLPYLVIMDVCEKFSIPKEDPRCEPGATVYAPEYSKTLRRTSEGCPKRTPMWKKCRDYWVNMKLIGNPYTGRKTVQNTIQLHMISEEITFTQ